MIFVNFGKIRKNYPAKQGNFFIHENFMTESTIRENLSWKIFIFVIFLFFLFDLFTYSLIELKYA